MGAVCLANSIGYCAWSLNNRVRYLLAKEALENDARAMWQKQSENPISREKVDNYNSLTLDQTLPPLLTASVGAGGPVMPASHAGKQVVRR